MQVGPARETARGWAEKALAIEPDNVEALSVLGLVSYQLDFNWSEGQRLLERAVEIAPGNVTANNFLGDFLGRIGNLNRALQYETRAAELDPLGPVQWTDMANIRMLQGRYLKAIENSQRALELDPAYCMAYLVQVDAYCTLGNLDAVEAGISTEGILSTDVSDFQMKLYHVRGEQAQVDGILARRINGAREGAEPFSYLADSAVFVGDFDTAGELLQQALAHGDGLWTYPYRIRLPEQAPDSAPWQAFWREPRIAELAEIRRRNGFSAQTPQSGELCSNKKTFRISERRQFYVPNYSRCWCSWSVDGFPFHFRTSLPV